MTATLSTPPTAPDPVRTPDGRRVRLSPDLSWLLERIGEGATLAAVAGWLADRAGAPVSEAQARELVVRTLVAHGLVRIGRSGRVTRVAADHAPTEESGPFRTLVTLVPAPRVTAVARALRVLGSWPALAAVALAGLAGSGAALAAANPTDPASWSGVATWLAVVAVHAFALFAHEWGHAFALAHGGGAPGAIALARLGPAPALTCDVRGEETLPDGARIAMLLGGPAWQLGAGALVVGALALAGVAAPAPVAAVLLCGPLLNLIPSRHQDGDRLSAVLAGAAEGTGLVWTPRVAPGRAKAPVDAHTLAMAALATALTLGLGAVLAPACWRTPGPGAVALAVVVTLAAAWMAIVAVTLALRPWRVAEAGVTHRRAIGPIRRVRNLLARLRALAPVVLGRHPQQTGADLVPVMLSLSFPERSPAQLRRAALRHIAETYITQLDHLELRGRGRPDEIRHGGPVRSLLAARQGAVVCALHLGPFHYVSLALLELGAPLTVFTATSVRRTYLEGWESKVSAVGGSFEALEAGTPKAALRAMRALEAGRLLVVYMDGQEGAGAARDTHRADFRFCGSELFMRTGPAFLAQRAAVPMVLAACYREGLVRRVVQFSDPFPPPDSSEDEALVARTAELYRWFEPHVRAHPEQWPGWLYPIMHWRETGSAPTATREAYDAAIRSAAGLLAKPGSARLVADATRSGWLPGREGVLLVHGPTRRVLQGTVLSRAVLEAAHRRRRVSDLPRLAGAPPEALAPEVARLVLAGLVELQGPDARV